MCVVGVVRVDVSGMCDVGGMCGYVWMCVICVVCVEHCTCGVVGVEY